MTKEAAIDAASTLTLRSPTLSAEVSTLGAELQRLTNAAGEELLWDGDPAFWTGRAPILFPVVGALREGRYHLDGVTYAMPKHGFARRSTFAVVEAEAAAARLRLEADDATRAIYPFEFQLDIVFTLDGATLTIEAEVANLGDAPMPASFGFHPALRRPLPFGRPRAEHRVLFEHDEPEPIRRIDAKGLLTPDLHPTPVEGRSLVLRDDLFTDDAVIFDGLNSRRLLYGGETGPQLAVTFPDLALLGIWTKPGADFICIEPWAGIADPKGFDGDLRDKPGVFQTPPGGVRRLGLSITLRENAAV